MSSAFQTLAKEALHLSSEERLALARHLLESVDGQPLPSVEAAWNVEIARRVERYRSGESVPIPAAEAFDRLKNVALGR